jgi:hypothetical protein
MIKFVELFNFLPGDRADYREWAEQVNSRLLQQPELLRMTVSENVLFTTPHRVVELEFEDLASMERYFERPEVREVYLEWSTRCTASTSLLLRTLSTVPESPIATD